MKAVVASVKPHSTLIRIAVQATMRAYPGIEIAKPGSRPLLQLRNIMGIVLKVLALFDQPLFLGEINAGSTCAAHDTSPTKSSPNLDSTSLQPKSSAYGSKVLRVFEHDELDDFACRIYMPPHRVPDAAEDHIAPLVLLRSLLLFRVAKNSFSAGLSELHMRTRPACMVHHDPKAKEHICTTS